MKYQCVTCRHIYDEEKEEERFDELPEEWSCPVCGSPKEMFMTV